MVSMTKSTQKQFGINRRRMCIYKENNLKGEIKPIRGESEYRTALDELKELFMAPKGSTEYDRAEILEILIESYDAKNYEIDHPDAIEAIKCSMEESDTNQIELGKIIGDKAKASLILNRKRKLSLTMIRNLHDRLNIPLTILINDYALVV